MKRQIISSDRKGVLKTWQCYFIVSTFLLGTQNLIAQDQRSTKSKKYTIGAIEITGTTTFSKQTIIAYTGLRKDDKIYLPGDKISGIIKKLWNLHLFNDINFYITKIEGEKVYLELHVEQIPELQGITINGVSKAKRNKYIKDNGLTQGVKVDENLITTTKNYIIEDCKLEGFLNAKVAIKSIGVKDSLQKETAKINMAIQIDKGERVKIAQVKILGNEKITGVQVRRAMKNSKEQKLWRFWKRSKFVQVDYEEDKKNILTKYKEKGYRDARIIKDSLIKEENQQISLQLQIEEGKRYCFGDIKFLGNTIFTNEQLSKQLIIKKGDVYNGVLLEKQIEDPTKPDADDLTNLYQNNGYLFSSIQPVEVSVINDTINYEIRIQEGKLAHFNHISVTGNDKTNDHVIYREIRTKPGQQYSKEQVVRTVRELGQLGYFDPEQIAPQFKNTDPDSGTLDIEYNLVEKGASQIQLQGGYGGSGFVGTLGLSFNNFSMRNIFKKEAYKPLPMGDGQKLGLRAQISNSNRIYSLSFVEPWLGGKKPFQLSTSFSHSTQLLREQSTTNNSGNMVNKNKRYTITGGTVGIAKRLNWPDNYFTLSQAIGFQQYNFKNWDPRYSQFTFPNGFSNDLNYSIELSRDNTYTNPIFPTGGSKFSLSAKFTFPYSLFNKVDYKSLALERAPLEAEYQKERLVDQNAVRNPRIGEIDQKRFNWQEYYKIKLKSEWYTRLIDKLVLKSGVEYGFIGAYNNDRGTPPLGRFFLGGSGQGAQQLDQDNIGLRGYPDNQVLPLMSEGNSSVNQYQGGTIYNKYSLELRYPITLKPSVSIYALSFMEAGAIYDNFRSYKPFQLNRSVGVGVRIFMPAFGLLGVDFGYRLDPIPGTEYEANQWKMNFVIGQQF